MKWRVLAIEQLWAVDAGGVVLVGCMRPVMAHGGCVWFSWALVVVCMLLCYLCVPVVFVRWSWWLLSFLDDWDCVIRWASCDVTWGRRGGEVDVGCHWAVC